MAAPFTARLLVVALTAIAAVASLSVGASPQPLLRATGGGDLKLGNSRDGQAILTVSRLKPGGSAQGTLTLENLAPRPQQLTLTMNGLQDMPGPGGGVLSRRLDLVIERGAEPVYAGKLADLPALDLGELAAASTVPYRFTVSLPEQGPAVDDAYAGASVRVSWLWRAEMEGGPSEPPPTPKPPMPDPPQRPVTPGEKPVRPSDAPPLAEPAPDVDELEGPAATRGPRLRLWLGGRPAQRVGRALGLSAVCRPACALRGTAKVKVGTRWRTLGRRTLGSLSAGPQPGALRFRLSARQVRSLKAALRRHGALTVRIAVTGGAAGHASATKVRTLRLRP